MLKLEGNTAAFLLYAYVRIEGIKRKVGKEIASLLKKALFSSNTLPRSPSVYTSLSSQRR